MKRHKHKFVAIPITGQNAWNGKEALFGFRLECEFCDKTAKPGDVIVELKQSWWKEIVPETKAINYIIPLGV